MVNPIWKLLTEKSRIELKIYDQARRTIRQGMRIKWTDYRRKPGDYVQEGLVDTIIGGTENPMVLVFNLKDRKTERITLTQIVSVREREEPKKP